MKIIKLFLIILVVGFFLLFVAQNSILVEVSFFNYKGYAPVFVLVLFSALAGFLIAFLYFLPREISLRSMVSNLRDGVERLNHGMFLKAEQNFQKNKILEPLLCLSLYEREDINKLLNLDSPISTHILLKLHQLEKAEERFKRVLETDPENLLALKGLRDISFLKSDLSQSLEYQERVLKACERWDRDNQKQIMAEILASLWMVSREEEKAEKAFDLCKTPFTYSVRISSLLNLGKEREAIRLFEKSFEEGFQNAVLVMLLNEEKTLTKLMDAIQKRWEQIDKIVLALVCIRLGLFSKVRSLLDLVPDYYRTLALASLSHKEEDRMCVKSLEEKFYPWKCVCGTNHKEYTPLCPSCLKWYKLELKLSREEG